MHSISKECVNLGLSLSKNAEKKNSVFFITGWFGGTTLNMIGPNYTMFLGSIGYSLYTVSSPSAFQHLHCLKGPLHAPPKTQHTTPSHLGTRITNGPPPMRRRPHRPCNTRSRNDNGHTHMVTMGTITTTMIRMRRGGTRLEGAVGCSRKAMVEGG